MLAHRQSALSKLWSLSRYYASSAGAQMEIFDGTLKAAHRDRASLHDIQADPLADEVAERLLDRLEDCTRTFSKALILGGSGVQIATSLLGGRAGIDSITYVDTSPGMLYRAQQHLENKQQQHTTSTEIQYILADKENEELPVDPGTYDVVISCLGLHWVNDVPGVMTQCRLALKPDGLFLAAMLGGNTLQELRIACTVAQQEREGGVSPIVSPLAQVRDAGNLLTRAGLSIPAVDVDDIQVMYRDPVSLVQHLRRMAENNALKQRRGWLPRDTALASAAAYLGLFGEENDQGDKGIPATFQVVYMTGWAPDPSQKKAAQRGTATVSFDDLSKALGSDGDKVD